MLHNVNKYINTYFPEKKMIHWEPSSFSNRSIQDIAKNNNILIKYVKYIHFNQYNIIIFKTKRSTLQQKESKSKRLTATVYHVFFIKNYY